MTKEERIKAEEDRLQELFANLPARQKATVKGLIENSAFMYCTLQDLQEEINRSGSIELYQNGANQSGYKESAAAQAYDKMLKNYTNVQHKLLQIIPKGEEEPHKTLAEMMEDILNAQEEESPTC